MNIPLELQARIAKLGTTGLQISIPHGTQITPEEVIKQLEQFISEIEKQDNERTRDTPAETGTIQ